MRLIRVIKETIVYVEVGDVSSSAPAYWERDFRPNARFEAGERVVVVEHPLREIDPIEDALFTKYQEVEG